MTPSVFATPAATFADAQLRAVIERIERLEAEKKTIGEDIADVYAEAKGNGFDVKALRQIVRERKQDANERAEQETILDTYRRALGMLADTPLGRAATEAATRAPPTRVRGYRPGGNNRMAG